MDEGRDSETIRPRGQGDASAPIILVVNWFEELTRLVPTDP